MSATAIIVGALAHAERDIWSCATVMSGLLATSQLRNALAPRISAACPLTAEMFTIVVAAPTAWCTAHLHLDSPTAAALQQTPIAFVQLRSIRVDRTVCDAPIDMTALTAMPASLNWRTLREIEFGPTIAISDDMLRDGLATVTARLESLIIGSGPNVTDAGLASLRDTPMTATLRKFSLVGSRGITDAGVAHFLGPASQLRSLTLAQCALLSGSFLTQLHENCHGSLAEIDLRDCTLIDDAGAAALCNFRGLTDLGLSYTARVTVLPLERLPLLRAVKGSFLFGCSGLSTLDLAALSKVTSVGDYVLRDCSGLTTLDVSGLVNVTHIGNSFMQCCSGLTTLDLAALTNVTSVGAYFLSSCSGLTTLGLSGLTNVAGVGSHFLSSCSGLATLDLTALANVKHVGASFLHDCKLLTKLDLSGLVNVTYIGNSFMQCCSGLTTLDLAALASVASVGDSFLRDCSGLMTLDLSGLTNVSVVGSHFLFSCSGLMTLDLSRMANVASVGACFLHGCSRLATLDLSGLQNVTSVGGSFLGNCNGLKNLRLSAPLLQHGLVSGKHKQLHARK